MTKDDEMIRRGDALALFKNYTGTDFWMQQIAALPAAQPGVKPLVWDDFEGLGAKAQAWKQANYLITWWKSRGQFEVVASYPGHQGEAIGAGFYPTLEAAKAAAQADYEARILAALDVQPAPDMAALVEALRRIAGDQIYPPGFDRDPEPSRCAKIARAALAAIEARK
jgi:hypothetical protein